MAQGFLYILINPAVPNYVKIGKTARVPDDRAKELSAATGVPVPFLVAYEAFFADCDGAEQYVQTLLEARGVHRAPNREFFSLPLREAIAVVMEAERSLGQMRSPSASDFGDIDTPVAPVSPNPIATSDPPVWLDALQQAEDHDYGWGDTLQDRDRAIMFYKQAARLGAPDAYIRLAELCADRDGRIGDADEGIRWLKRGVENGIVECWAALAFVYMGENAYFDTPPHPENARKAWRRFFTSIRPAEFDPEGSRLYGMLRKYASIVRSGGAPEDVNAISAFEGRFAEVLMALPAEGERCAKLRELRQLVEGLS